MAGTLDSQRIGAVFQSRPDIIEGIKREADSSSSIALFNEIANHVYSQLHGTEEPAQKRRRVGLEPSNGAATPIDNGKAADEVVLLSVKEISVSVPQRKKFELCITPNFLYARAPGTTAPIPGIIYAWKDIEYAFFLPVPEKAQAQHNYVLFPRGAGLPPRANQPPHPPAAEPLAFTVPFTTPKEGTIGGSEAGAAASVSDTYRSLFHWAFSKRFKNAGNPIDIISADASKFHSVIRQPHRPNEKAVHVNGFRGSKDGYLFFLGNGILWGFKKPLIFIPLARIAAISYTNILQITFNIVVEVFCSEGDATEEVEFDMLDQQDYGSIDNYIKLNRLQDRSMAEQRKGKLQLAENRVGKKGAEDGQNGDGEESAVNGMSELARAQLEADQQLDDEEDEDEEDYDPGSEGESEGSGDSSDDDDDDDDDDDAEGEDDDEEEEEADGEQEAEETEEVKEPEVQEEEKPKPKAKPKPRVKKEPAASAKTSQVPLRQGWAAVGSKRQADDMDLDDEKFDVV
ncbi:hypothetical protein HIM_01183 [Hirsutella minnesotensis 3608]|nr:hypothetical protein HIM_01183 [Hirsutella minnesotensis 3608]